MSSAIARIPLPSGCTEWTLLSKVNINNISTMQDLMNPITIRVARDCYTQSSINEHVSLLTYITDPIVFDKCLNIVVNNIDDIPTFIDPHQHGNILHAVINNPNVNNIIKFCQVMDSINDTIMPTLCEGVDETRIRPIEYTHNITIFRYILSKTKITERQWSRLMINNYTARQYSFNAIFNNSM